MQSLVQRKQSEALLNFLFEMRRIGFGSRKEKMRICHRVCSGGGVTDEGERSSVGWNQPGTSVDKGRDLAVFPLAVPAIAGPEAIMAIILLTDNDVDSVSERAETAVVLLVMLVLNYNLTSSVRRHSADHWPTRCSSSHPGHGDHSRRACGRIHSYRFVNR